MRPSLPRLRWRILALANAQDRRRFLNRRRKYRAFARATVNAMSDIPGAEFIRTFRLDKSEVRALTVLLTPILRTQRRKDGISPNLKVSKVPFILYCTRYSIIVQCSAVAFSLLHKI